MARVRGNATKAPDTLPVTITDQHGNVTATYTSEMVQTIKDTVAQGATDSELIMFLKVASDYDLDPVLGQVYFAKMKGKPTIMTGRDGFRKIAQRKPNFKKCQSMAVYENDEFKIVMEDGEATSIMHTFAHKDRGAVIGAYAILKTTDGEKQIAWADITEYDTGKNAWEKYKSAMIKKVAETEVYKNFADISGVYAEEAMPSAFSRERQLEDDNQVLNDEYLLDVEVVDKFNESEEPECFTDLLGYNPEEKEAVEEAKQTLSKELKGD